MLFLIKSISGSENGHHFPQAHTSHGAGIEPGGPSMVWWWSDTTTYAEI